MEIALNVLFLIIGLVLIIKGGDWFVDSSTWIAKVLGVPEIIIGATIVSIGTTLPELLTSLIAVVKGMQSADAQAIQSLNEIAVGNAVGSMLCNIGLILALVIAIKPPKAEGNSFLSKGIALIIATVCMCVFALTDSKIVLWEGIVLLVFFIAFMTMNVVEAVKDNKETARLVQIGEQEKAVVEKDKKVIAKNSIFFIIGAGAIAFGAICLVSTAQTLCLKMGISSQIVGVTVVAIGTSLPELVTSITSLKKGSDIGIGNIIGANMINCTLLIGLISVVTGSGLPIDNITKNVGVWVLLGITALLLIPTMIKKKTFRWQGATMLATYLGFMIYNVIEVI